MVRSKCSPLVIARTAVRLCLLTIALAVPILVVQHVQAGTSTIIENTYKPSSGAGLVLVVSLQRG